MMHSIVYEPLSHLRDGGGCSLVGWNTLYKKNYLFFNLICFILHGYGKQVCLLPRHVNWETLFQLSKKVISNPLANLLKSVSNPLANLLKSVLVVALQCDYFASGMLISWQRNNNDGVCCKFLFETCTLLEQCTYLGYLLLVAPREYVQHGPLLVSTDSSFVPNLRPTSKATPSGGGCL